MKIKKKVKKEFKKITRINSGLRQLIENEKEAYKKMEENQELECEQPDAQQVIDECSIQEDFGNAVIDMDYLANAFDFERF